VLVSVFAQIPPPVGKTLALTAQVLLVGLLSVVHLLEILFRQILCSDELVGIMMADERIISDILRRITCQIAVRNTSEVNWL